MRHQHSAFSQGKAPLRGPRERTTGVIAERSPTLSVTAVAVVCVSRRRGVSLGAQTGRWEYRVLTGWAPGHQDRPTELRLPSGKMLMDTTTGVGESSLDATVRKLREMIGINVSVHDLQYGFCRRFIRTPDGGTGAKPVLMHYYFIGDPYIPCSISVPRVSWRMTRLKYRSATQARRCFPRAHALEILLSQHARPLRRFPSELFPQRDWTVGKSSVVGSSGWLDPQ